ncbi:Neuropeptide FF receptor 2-like 2, partial [Homarus americanus]
NAALLWVLARHKRLHTSINLFIGNLAVADLLLAASCPTLFILEDFYQNYILGAIGCRLQGFIQTFLMMVSVLSLTLVAGERLALVTGERLGAVATPQRKRLSLRVAVAACCLTWLMSAIVAAPLGIYRFFVDRLWLDYEETFCAERTWVTEEYWPFLVVVLIWFPMIFLIVSYMIIFCKLDKYEAGLRGRGHPSARRKRRRLLSLTFVVLLVFVVCYTPFTIFLIVRAVLVVNSEQARPYTHGLHWYLQVDVYFDFLWWTSHWLAYLNSAINPLIYGLTNKGFLRALRSSCTICVASRRAVAPATDDHHHPPHPHHAHVHRAHSHHTLPDQEYLPHLGTRQQCRPRTPLAVEALRGNGSSSKRSSTPHDRTSLVKGKKTSRISLCGDSCPEGCLHTRDEGTTQDGGSNETKHQGLSRTRSSEPEIFVTETSRYILSSRENSQGSILKENDKTTDI